MTLKTVSSLADACAELARYHAGAGEAFTEVSTADLADGTATHQLAEDAKQRLRQIDGVLGLTDPTSTQIEALGTPLRELLRVLLQQNLTAGDPALNQRAHGNLLAALGSRTGLNAAFNLLRLVEGMAPKLVVTLKTEFGL